MSMYPILWAAEHAPVYDAEERAVLIALVMKGDFDGSNCFRSYSTLGRVARVDAKTAGRKCREMESRGILRRQRSHISKAWHSIPEKQRPVVWEVMIPAEWWSPAQLSDINDQRASLGRPAITPKSRPALGEAPPKKTRSDKGVKRKKGDASSEGVGTDSPWGDPGTTSPHPGDYKSPPPGLVVPQPSETPSETPSEKNTPSLPVADPPVDRPTAGERDSSDGHVIPLFEGDAGQSAPQVDAFDEFWAAYPRKVGKGAARKAFAAAVKRGVQPNVLIAALGAHAVRWKREGTATRFIPHAATWLNGERYDDELPSGPVAAAGGHVPWQQQAPESAYHAGW